MIDLKKYHIVDLSVGLYPGILKVNGEYIHSKQLRRLEIRQFIYKPDKMLMHWVDTETHIGTHVEGPSHRSDKNKGIAELPIDTFMGEAVVLNFDSLKPVDGKPQPIMPQDLSKAEEGDIVLMWSSLKRTEAPYISPQAAKWLWEKRIKMLGIQGIGLEAPGSLASHEYLLGNDIPIIEGLVNLGKLKAERVFYIGLPIKIYGMDSSWVRAIALEES